ncbi:hypothetical protein FRC02_009447 [Tulasnella sp. 418]|nr:hypothetical protein FRC02_009447 [Tulasnella sp. 418]
MKEIHPKSSHSSNENTPGPISTSLTEMVAMLLKNGVISLLLDISRLKIHQHHAASYVALEGFAYLCRCADQTQVKAICREVVSKNGFRQLLEDLKDSPKFPQRAYAGKCIEMLLRHTPLADELDISQIRDLFQTATMYCIEGCEPIYRALQTPENSYMDETITYNGHIERFAGKPCDFKKANLPTTLAHVLPVWLRVQQDSILVACTAALWRGKAITRRECLLIVKQKPEILSRLLLITSSPRSRLDLESWSDMIAARLLCQLMHLPLTMNSSQYDIQRQPETRAAVECNQILFDHPNSALLLIGAWNRILSENPYQYKMDILEQWKIRKYPELGRGSTIELGQARGTVRICMLRLFSNFTLAVEAPTPFFLVLLPIAYSACYRVPDRAKVSRASEEDPEGYLIRCEYEERHIVAVKIRQHKPGSKETFFQLYIQQETIIGPTLLFQVLARLSDCGYGLRELRRMKKMPDDTPMMDTQPTHLAHIHQIVDPKVIGKLIRLSVKRRLVAQREKGAFYLVKDPALAKEIYISGSHLANAVIDFGLRNQLTEGVTENADTLVQAQQELVFHLGNACEAAAKMGDITGAKGFAQAALRQCDSVVPDAAMAIGWDLKSSKEKNQRRLDQLGR